MSIFRMIIIDVGRSKINFVWEALKGHDSDDSLATSK